MWMLLVGLWLAVVLWQFGLWMKAIKDELKRIADALERKKDD